MLEKENVIIKGSKPELSNDKKYIYYGLYPQSNINDIELINELEKLDRRNTNEFGYYLYNNEYYYKLEKAISPWPNEFNGYKFDNGVNIKKGKSYWFKVEPIKWRILEDEGNTYLLFSDSILVNHRYNELYKGMMFKACYDGDDGIVFANNYKYSEIREFINVKFYKQAFFLGASFIKPSEVDNSENFILDRYNKYVCENTFDKLFLLSTKELVNRKYGFDSNKLNLDKNRRLTVTDYARAIGTETTFAFASYKKGNYFTRSSFTYNTSSSYVSFVTFRGEADGSRCSDSPQSGVAVAFRLMKSFID